MLRQEIHRLVDALPEANLADLLRWLRHQRGELAAIPDQQAQNGQPRYTPVNLAGLWQGVTISDTDVTIIGKQERRHDHTHRN